MKILIVSQHFYPDNFRINEISIELVKRCHHVEVLTGLPDYTSKNIPNEYKNHQNRDEIYHGVKIHRVPIIPRKTGVYNRFLNYMSFAINSSLYAKLYQQKFDIALVYQTSPVSMAIPAIISAKKFSKSVLLYCLDVWPESVKAWSIGENKYIYSFVKYISKYIYKNCDHIAVSSKPFIGYLNNINKIPQNKISYLPQHSDDLFDSPCEYLNNKCIDFVFTGNIGSVQNIDTIILACQQLRNLENFKVHIVGGGSELERIKSLVKSLNLQHKVILYGWRPYNKMKDFSILADCFLLSLTGENFIGMTMPAKLQSYMSAGKFIIASADGATKDTITQANCGVCSKAGDENLLAENMRKFIENPHKYYDLGLNGRDYFKKYFTLDKFMDNLEILLNNNYK